MTVAEIERLLRLGMCSPGRHREVGCATCDACEAAIAEVRRLAEVERQARALVDSFKGTHSIREMTGPGIAALNLLLNALDELKAKRKTEARRDA